MKWLFLILLAANLAYYFLNDDSVPEAAPTTATASVPTILLLSEAKQQGLYPLHDPASEPASEPAPSIKEAPTPAQPLSPTAADLHRAVYPEGDDTDSQDRSSRSTPVKAGKDSDVSPARETPNKQTANKTGRDARGLAADDAPRKTQTVSETPPPKAPKPAATATSNQARCFRIGPFGQLATAKAAGRKMITLGFRGRLLQTTAKHSVNYQVYLGPYSDPDERQFAIDELIDAGMTDISFGRSKDGNILIIGSYPSRKLTKPVIATLQTLGYNPHIEKRSKPTQRFYLDLEALDGSGSPSPKDRLTTAFPDIGLKSRACRR